MLFKIIQKIHEFNRPKPFQISDSVKKNITGLYLKDFTYIYLHRKNFRHVSSGNRHFRNMWTKNYIAARVVGRSENPEGKGGRRIVMW